MGTGADGASAEKCWAQKGQTTRIIPDVEERHHSP